MVRSMEICILAGEFWPVAALYRFPSSLSIPQFRNERIGRCIGSMVQSGAHKGNISMFRPAS